ncbi:acyltransferase [Sulfitobacter albidus]|uniref:Acyltransferase n=1 Tax=Sulfitobacter albidus TaxID=2829501 RepID=A0A975JC07_9RHOB|nr:acyltransferase [Sulfitobacter albidus]QUJ75676.1 acyltransferase [Sulfitobacter albidus]
MTDANARLHALDSAKGIGIILVVFGHAWRGAFGAGLIPETGLFAAVDTAIYAFHMPLFFFLSGLLFLDTLEKYRADTLLKSRVSRLLWPMALWTWLFFGMKLVGGAAVNAPVDLADVPLIPLPPYEHLWFLWALFLCQSLVILLYAAWPRAPSRGVAEYCALGLAIALTVGQAFIGTPSLIWGPMIAHLPFFLLGIGLGTGRINRPSALLMILAAAAFGFQLLAVVQSGVDRASIPTSAALLIFFWIVWLGVDRDGDARVLKLLRSLGAATMVIYLTHTIFSAALRIALVKLGIDALPVLLLATTAIGLAAPFAVLGAARKLRLVKVLGF